MQEANDQVRLEFFVNEIVKNEAVWLLQAEDGLFAMVEDAEGNSYVSVWPTKSECEAVAKDEWSGYQAESMEIKEFLNWLKELKDDDVRIGVYPDINGRILPFESLGLKKLIETELKEKPNFI
jgi:hypothetical protein